MHQTTITPTDNGPYLVQGNPILLDADGNPYQAGETIALCRCGQSSTKPFCDGTHEKVNCGDQPLACEQRSAAQAS
jgi:CDGSH-type Zn-finger protein